jgi:O-antigen ligase
MSKIKNNLFIIVTILLFVSLIFNLKILPYFLALFLISSLVINYRSFKFIEIKPFLKKSLIVLFFLINLISFIYSKNINNALKLLETQISLALIPFLIFPFYKSTTRIKDLIFKAYILVIFVAIAFSLINFISKGYFLLTIENSNNFRRALDYSSHYKLSNLLHPSYYSMFVLLALVFFVKVVNLNSKTKVIFGSVFIIYLVSFLIILGSRAALICLLFLMVYYGYKVLSNNSVITKLIVFALFLFITASLMKYSRFNSNIIAIRSMSSIEEIDIRVSLWKDAFIVWKEKPLFGHGVGDSKNRLVEVHKLRNIDEAVKRKYNCHNQFLETATQTGFLGLIILLLVFAIPLYQSIKKKQELLFLFLMISFINFLFESMLQRIAGVVFFAFWYSFLWLVYYKHEKVKLN